MKILQKDLLVIEENGRKIRFSEIVLSKILEALFLYALGLVNSLLLSGYSPEAVSIVNIVNQVFNLGIILPNMIVTGMAIHMNVALGQKNTKVAGIIGGTAGLLVTGVGLLVGLVVIFAGHSILSLMNVEPHMMDSALRYLRCYFAFMPVAALMNCVNNMLICNGYASRTFLVGALYNLLNATFCYFALYTGIFPTGDKLSLIPFMTGSAWITGLFIAITFFRAKKCAFRLVCRLEQAKRILTVGIPGGMNGFSFRLSQTVTTAFIALLGMSVFNTKVYIDNIIAFSSIISLAIAQAGAIFSGRYRGRGEFESIQRLYKQNRYLAVGANLMVSVLIFLFRKPLIGMFTKDPAALQLASVIMLVDIGVEIFRALNQVNDQALNANGDVKTTFLVSTLSCWGFSVLFSYLLGIRAGLGLPGVWIAFLLDECFKTAVYTIRWKSGAWKKTKL